MAVRVPVGYGGCLVGMVLASRSRFLLYTKHCWGKKVFGKKRREKKNLLREFCGGEVYIYLPTMKVLHEIYCDA